MTASKTKANDNGRATERERGFDPKAHMRQLKGQDYLEARWRVVWFREENPDGQIETEIVYHDREKKEIMFRATVTVPASGASATGYCEGSERDFKFGYVEKAETQAVGRALAFLGYGTAQAAELDIADGEKIADAPLDARRAVPLSGPASVGAAPDKAAREPAPPVVRAPGRPPALERVADEIAAAGSGDAGGDEAGALPGQGRPPRTATADGIRRNALFAGIRALAGAGVTLDTGERWKELARTYELVEPARNADMTVGWLEELYRRMRARQTAQGEAGGAGGAAAPTTTAPVQTLEQVLAAEIAAAPDKAALEEVARSVLAHHHGTHITDAAAEALGEAVDGRAAALDLYAAEAAAGAQTPAHRRGAGKEEGREATAAASGQHKRRPLVVGRRSCRKEGASIATAGSVNQRRTLATSMP